MAEVTMTYTAEITRVMSIEPDHLDRLVETVRAKRFASDLATALKTTQGYDDVNIRDVKVFITKEEANE